MRKLESRNSKTEIRKSIFETRFAQRHPREKLALSVLKGGGL
jgi:hypothetical protein